MKLWKLLIVWMILNAFLSRLFDYCLMSIIGKDIPWYADFVVALVSGPLWVPVSVACWVLRLCDIDAPFFDLGTP